MQKKLDKVQEWWINAGISQCIRSHLYERLRLLARPRCLSFWCPRFDLVTNKIILTHNFLFKLFFFLVLVHGVEYAFGCHEQDSTGIFEGEPKQCEGFTFRKQVLIGWTDKNLREVRGIMDELAQDYKGVSYNLITKNCNHFCNDVCVRLTGNSIPSWINRLARIGKSKS